MRQRGASLFLMITLFCGLLAGCTPDAHSSSDSAWRQESGRLKVLSTIAMIDDLVKHIGGDDIDSIALIRGELDPHSYELVKGDDEKFAQADLIFYNGLGLEHGLSLRQHLENNPKSFAVGEPLLKNESRVLLTIEGQFDPHIWMDVRLWMETIDPIVDALSEKDPLHAANYQQRAEVLKKIMQAEDESVYQKVQAVPAEKRYLVTSHDAFHYFTRRYLATPEETKKNLWNCRCAAPEGLAPDAQLSVADLQEIITHIAKYKITVLFPESNVSKDSLRKIVQAGKEKGFPIRLSEHTLYGDSMGNGSYINMIKHNAEVIVNELNRE